MPAELRRAASEEEGNGSTFTGAVRSTLHRWAATTTGTVGEVDKLSVLSVDPFAGKARLVGTAAALAAGLTRESLVALLFTHVDSVKAHLSDLRARVLDGSSRILITGDLNAGKSTFVNALLRREIAPMDQQPCTEVLCEILDASHNDGVEEIHAVRLGATYDRHDHATFIVYALDHLNNLVSALVDEDDNDLKDAKPSFEMLKVYVQGCADLGSQSHAASLLRDHNISVSFIDGPGLNRDTLSTTALFAKQSTIDVVLFVVSAENQFTLSAQEFLWAASQEKAYVFVVVNKWDAISNKARAERRVRDQVRKLSPGTWECRRELVHFVDSLNVLRGSRAGLPSDSTSSFGHLERSLSSFVLLKRFVSKLQPAQTYMRNLLHDLDILADLNAVAACEQHAEAGARLEHVVPECERLVSARSGVDQGIERIEERTIVDVLAATKARLNGTFAAVSQGRLPTGPLHVPYPGITGIWQYAADVQAALAAAVETEVRACEETARHLTTSAVGEIREGLGSHVLPTDVGHTERIFNPDVMFARRRKTLGTAPAALSVGLGVPDALELHVVDLFDLDRLSDIGHRLLKPAAEDNALSLVGGVGIGSLALFSTGAAGGKAFVDAAVRVSELLGSEAARKWAGVAAALLAVGLGAYLVADLPHAVPRNVGRKISRRLNQQGAWADEEAHRVSKETRKVLRLAGWDLRERLRAAVEQAQAEEDNARESKETAANAQSWFANFAARIEALSQSLDTIDASVEWRD